MTLDELQRRDGRIALLEAMPAAHRSAEEQDELAELVAKRDRLWRRLPAMHERALRRTRELEAYAAQHRLPLEAA